MKVVWRTVQGRGWVRWRRASDGLGPLPTSCRVSRCWRGRLLTRLLPHNIFAGTLSRKDAAGDERGRPDQAGDHSPPRSTPINDDADSQPHGAYKCKVYAIASSIDWRSVPRLRSQSSDATLIVEVVLRLSPVVHMATQPLG